MSASADSRPILVPQHYVVLVNYLEREFAAVADALAGTSTPSMPLEGQLAVNAIDRMLGVLAGTAQDFASACNGSLGQAFADGTHLSDGDMRAIARSACEPVLLLARGIVEFQGRHCAGAYAKPQQILLTAAREVLSGMLEFAQGLARLIHFPGDARARIAQGEITLQYQPQPGPALREFSQWLASETQAAEALRTGMSQGSTGGTLTPMLLLAALGWWVAA